MTAQVKVSNNTSNNSNRKPFNRRKNTKKGRPALRHGEPVFIYPCVCHGEKADKEPCERESADREDGKFSTSSLGTWRCSVTKRKTKVTRRKNKPEEVPTEG